MKGLPFQVSKFLAVVGIATVIQSMTLIAIPKNVLADSWWQPIATIKNPDFPITVELVNKTGSPLEYGYTDSSPDTLPQRIPVDSTVKALVKNSESNIAVSPIETDLRLQGLEFTAKVNGSNSIILVINKATKPDLQGDAIGEVIDIQKAGGIFVY